MNPRITVRNIASPQRWGPAQAGAWHHILPFSLLRDVWNRLVDRHIESQIPEARVALRQYLLLLDRSLPGADSLIDRMRAENTGQRRAGHNTLQPLTVSEAHQLATAAVWPPWNTVEGPARRSDDPGDTYFDRFTSGLTAEESARMLTIERLFRQLNSFIQSGPVPSAGSLAQLTQSVLAARPALACDRPIAYRPEMWVQDAGGLWRKRRDGEAYTAAAG